MENTNQPSPPQDQMDILRAIVARLGALERQVAEQSVRAEGAEDDQSLSKAELAAELERHRSQQRDYEKALVDRIADVDDDRRTTTSRLQRAWQTQREEIDERLRRHAGLWVGLVVLFVVVFAVALFVVYRQAVTAQPQDVAELAEMRQELARVAEKGAATEQARAQLASLAIELGEIGSSFERLDQNREQAIHEAITAESAAREKAVAALTAEIRRLDAEQKRIAAALGYVPSPTRTDYPADPAGTGREDGAAMSTAESMVSVAMPAAEDADDGAAADVGPGEIQEDVSVVKTAEEVGGKAEGGERLAPAVPDAGAPASERTLVAGGDIYALQLIGFFTRESLDAFLDRKGLPKQVYTFQQTYKGRPWHVLIHSLHDEYAEAEEALSNLPPDLAALNPWIRPLSQVTELQIIETGQEHE